jgi:hypothetical protein
MRPIVVVWLSALLCVALVSCATAQEKEAPKELESALVVIFGDAEKEVSKVHRLTDAKQLAALEAFFPNYRSRPVGKGRPGFATHTAWYPDYEVYFNFHESETVRLEVTLLGVFPRWRASRGDHELKGDFRKFIAGLKPHEKPHLMEGFLRVPKEARLGDVEIKVSWPAFQRITEGGTTMKVFILPLK